MGTKEYWEWEIKRLENHLDNKILNDLPSFVDITRRELAVCRMKLKGVTCN